ncbi:hypothetical protein Bca52824_056271 [Brassica carinata]|uniref:Uncharacterized protein n=1 Tax=Brassica carinata TaxID=52824 RepID=A0A8X7QP65_BRACI|nr:hypothetical protein Bca52824_056271 [Brassica carinata]
MRQKKMMFGGKEEPCGGARIHFYLSRSRDSSQLQAIWLCVGFLSSAAVQWWYSQPQGGGRGGRHCQSKHDLRSSRQIEDFNMSLCLRCPSSAPLHFRLPRLHSLRSIHYFTPAFPSLHSGVSSLFGSMLSEGVTLLKLLPSR